MATALSAPVESLFDVFLSYNKMDKEVVTDLAHRLTNRAQIRVWLDQWNLIPGDEWMPDIERALATCRSVAVLFGPRGTSPWQRAEMQAAIRRRVQETNTLFRVIPVLLPGTKKDNISD